MDQKTFKSADATLDKRPKLCSIARHNPAPECDIDGAFPLRRLKLFLKSGECRCRRDAVERHIDNCRHAACRGCPRRGQVALPLGATGLVDVNVGVDISRHDHGIVGIYQRNIDGRIIPLAYRRDLPAAEMDRGRAN